MWLSGDLIEDSAFALRIDERSRTARKRITSSSENRGRSGALDVGGCTCGGHPLFECWFIPSMPQGGYLCVEREVDVFASSRAECGRTAREGYLFANLVRALIWIYIREKIWLYGWRDGECAALRNERESWSHFEDDWTIFMCMVFCVLESNSSLGLLDRPANRAIPVTWVHQDRGEWTDRKGIE